MSIGIRYYRLTNNGLGIVIYPQLRSVDDPAKNILWDGRDILGLSHLVATGHDVIVDLSDVNIIDNQGIVLSENTVFGDDEYTTQATLHFDKSSNLIATAERWGPLRGGSLVYGGVMPYPGETPPKPLSENSQAPSVVAATIHEVIGLIRPENSAALPWKGTVIYAPNSDVTTLVKGMTAIATAMIAQGYYAPFTLHPGSNTTTFNIGMREGVAATEGPGSTGVPVTVRQNWNAAVNAGIKLYPQLQIVNQGIVDAQK